MRLKNGAATHLEEAGVVLAKYNGEWVTWCVDVEGYAHWGHYHGNELRAACDDFWDRVDQEMARRAV